MKPQIAPNRRADIQWLFGRDVRRGLLGLGLRYYSKHHHRDGASRRRRGRTPPSETASTQVLFFGRNGRIYHSGGHRHWNVGFYIFFMIFSLIYLAVRVWVSLIVTKLYSLLMKIGEHRAKEVDDHHSYDAKCACMP